MEVRVPLPSSMRAVVSDRAGGLMVQERPTPRPGSTDVLIRVLRCGVCGSDLQALREASRQPDRLPQGTILGHEYSGIVEAVGEAVRDLVPGNLVASMAFDACGVCASCRAGRPARCRDRRSMRGGWAQYVCTTTTAARLLPSSLPPEIGAWAEPLAVALRAVQRGSEGPASRVAVLGPGSVGRLVAMASVRQRAGLVATLGRRPLPSPVDGAAHVVLGDGGRQALFKVLGGKPDVVFDCAGGADSLSLALSLVADGGRVVAVGAAEGEVAIRPFQGLLREADVAFSLAYDERNFDAAVVWLTSEPQTFGHLQVTTTGLDGLPDAVVGLQVGGRGAKVQVDPWV